MSMFSEFGVLDWAGLIVAIMFVLVIIYVVGDDD